MIFTETPLKGAFVIELERLEDERGLFARTWCRREAAARGLDPNVVQCDLSFNIKNGTLRGMHYQIPPFAEAKLIRCTRGSLHDVIIDLRPRSATFQHWFSVVLGDENRRMLYVPKGFAHGFQTLEGNTEVFYQMSEFYEPDYARGVRWNDPRFSIKWPAAEERTISDKDQALPDSSPEHFLVFAELSLAGVVGSCETDVGR